MKRTKAYRRSQRERMEHKVKKMLYNAWHQERYESDDEIVERSSRMADTRKPCSCSSCCNPRRSGWGSEKTKRTIQERRFIGDVE